MRLMLRTFDLLSPRLLAPITEAGQQMRKAHKVLVEFWLWSYKDPVGGHACRTTEHMEAKEATAYPKAKRIPGTLQFRQVEVDFADTAPEVFFEEAGR